MTIRPLAGVALIGVTLVTPASAVVDVVAETSHLQFHSDFLLNLHHTLFGAAWARRPEARTLRALAGRLPAPLEAPLSPEERSAWDAAVSYYDQHLASRDLLFDRRMSLLKRAFAAGDSGADAVGKELRAVLEAVTPVYRGHFWPAHDRANRAWISTTADNLKTIAPDVIKRLEQLYGVPWFTSPIRVDVVWVGNRQGAYTTNGPTHVVISSGDPEHNGWTSVETVFHEVSHTLVLPIQERINRALGDRARAHGVVWHVVQFYLTGAVVQEALKSRGIDYTPYMYSTGLLDRAWSQYRRPVEDNWAPYVAGKISLEEAVARTVASVK
jgi:hypothetical protein